MLLPQLYIRKGVEKQGNRYLFSKLMRAEQEALLAYHAVFIEQILSETAVEIMRYLQLL